MAASAAVAARLSPCGYIDPEVVKPCRRPSYQECTTTSTVCLTTTTMTELRAEFVQRGHHPSEAQYEALQDVASIMAAMAEGTCPPSFYLSSLDPGVGKTSLYVTFIRQLLGSPAHSDVAVMICLSRLQEVEGLIDKLRDLLDHVAVYTSDEMLNGLTQTPTAEARVLITTHQMVERHCRGRSFSEAKAFQYEGLSREVRVWDEAMLPGDVITLTTDQLARLRDACRRPCPDLADAVEALEEALKACGQGKTFRIPKPEELGGRLYLTVLEGLSKDGSDGRTAEAAAALIYLAGRKVSIHQSHYGFTSALDCRDTLPADLGPIVILDASGRVRHTYRLWEQHRGDLIRLKEAPKDYRNLRVHVWPRGGGKASWSRHGDVLVQGIAATINTKPEERWLIIHHKDGGELGQQIEDLASVPRENLCYLHWGSHHGINEYANVRNVILAGTLFLPELIYEGRARLAAGLHPGVPLPEQALAELERGEHADAILQGLCRAAVRNSVGASCAPCEAYIITSAKSGIAKQLSVIFPGCRVERWQPVRKELKGKVASAVEFVSRHFEAEPDQPLLLKDIREELRMGASNFRRAIRNHPDFAEALEELGVEEVILSSSRHANSLSRISSAFSPLDEDVQGAKT